MPSGSSIQPFVSGLAIDQAGTAVYAVDSSDSLVAGFQIDSTTGALTATPSVVAPGIFPEQAIVDPGGKYLFVTEDATSTLNSFGDQDAGIAAFAIDPSPGDLEAFGVVPFDLPAGSQPAGIVMDPTGSFLYAALSNSLAASGGAIAGFAGNSVSGFTQMAGSPFASGPADSTQITSICIHPSGKFLYSLNLNGGSVSAFNIHSQTGVLSPVAGSPFKGQGFPTNPSQSIMEGPIAVDPSGGYLYVLTGYPAIAIYKINQTTGALNAVSGSPVSTPGDLLSITTVQAP
jgi:6-phosphogluconolactonase (cycloisomerase 2 family)